MTKSDCCGEEVKERLLNDHLAYVPYTNEFICKKCGKPCTLSEFKPKVDKKGNLESKKLTKEKIERWIQFKKSDNSWIGCVDEHNPPSCSRCEFNPCVEYGNQLKEIVEEHFHVQSLSLEEVGNRIQDMEKRPMMIEEIIRAYPEQVAQVMKKLQQKPRVTKAKINVHAAELMKAINEYSGKTGTLHVLRTVLPEILKEYVEVEE